MSKTTKTGPSDYGTAELAKRHRTRVEFTGKGYAVRVRVLDGCEIDRLLHTGRLTQIEHNLAEKFMGLAHRGGLIALKATQLGLPGGGNKDPQPISQHKAMAQRRMNRIINWLDRKVGREARSLLWNVVVEDYRVESLGSLALLQDALRGLSEFPEDWSPHPPRKREVVALLNQIT